MKVPDGIQKWGQYYFVELNAEEAAELAREVHGSGGFETFFRGLQTKVNHATRTVKLTDADIGEIAHYAFDYKQGGWESRLLKTFARTLGPKLCRE